MHAVLLRHVYSNVDRTIKNACVCPDNAYASAAAVRLASLSLEITSSTVQNKARGNYRTPELREQRNSVLVVYRRLIHAIALGALHMLPLQER